MYRQQKEHPCPLEANTTETSHDSQEACAVLKRAVVPKNDWTLQNCMQDPQWFLTA